MAKPLVWYAITCWAEVSGGGEDAYTLTYARKMNAMKCARRMAKAGYVVTIVEVMA